MKPLSRAFAAGLSAAALIVPLAACSSPGEQAPTTGPCAGESLRVSQSTSDSLLYTADAVAQDKDLYAEQGLQIETMSLGGGSEAIQALVGGSVDVTISAHPTVISTRAEGGPVVSFATLMDDLLFDLGMKSELAPAERDEESVLNALRGKRIGVTSAGSASDQAIRHMAKQAGMNPESDFEIVPTGGAAEITASFANGGIDAYLISPPASRIAADKGDGEIVLNLAQGEAPSTENIMWLTALTNEETLADRQSALGCYATALQNAMQLIKNEPEEAKQVVRDEFEQITDEQFNDAFDQVVEATADSVAVDPELADASFDFATTIGGKLNIDSAKTYTTKVTDQVVK
ncbi:ABC-type nitrate/sulfonate/bicarbonate transport system substrate-binding protein [Tamaricihabitans halophyticus]|uniref:ABC-type nitrate/sulfonate/bicarbonate transport system substrate-binding protein n=1 Tax=Tamaricihabitans halophyticus TaxID=1262583 RepID=A0A4V2SV04_9PSEU|nr:ABC transporter substrate-binding protein [Tamaricihabitans halophyticus]TCP56636.1 ABC-type nitrate/sulfonate/bicarbonate transport system substrate-binding protein [Tamaricihabitans halophyticus]